MDGEETSGPGVRRRRGLNCAPAREYSAPMPRPTTALIVDDEPSARVYVRLLLKELGLTTCWEAEDGAQALMMFAQHQPGLVLLDVNLRMTTGLQVLQRLKHSHPKLPVIMLSSEDATATVDEAMRLGAAAYLLKHSPKEDALKRLRTALDSLKDEEAGGETSS
jgi:DNA-binding NarL/FixJ family response regulator